MPGEDIIPEETVGLSYHFLPPDRQAEIDAVLRVLEEDPRLEFLLVVLAVTINDRPLSASTPPSRGLLRKLLSALDAGDGEMMLYASPYNGLGREQEQKGELPRIEEWNFDLADRLRELPNLRSVRAFLEHGTGFARHRPPEIARQLHDRLLHALLGGTPRFAVWGCTDVRTGRQPARAEAPPGLWPADDVSPWFHGVFWDDMLFILNPAESTLTLLALTSR